MAIVKRGLSGAYFMMARGTMTVWYSKQRTHPRRLTRSIRRRGRTCTTKFFVWRTRDISRNNSSALSSAKQRWRGSMCWILEAGRNGRKGGEMPKDRSALLGFHVLDHGIENHKVERCGTERE